MPVSYTHLNTALTLSSLTLGDGSSTNLTFNTDYAGTVSYTHLLDAGDKTTGRTITFNTGLTCSGKLTKIGAGTLVLNGAAKVPVPAEGETAAVPGFTLSLIHIFWRGWSP